MQREIDKAHRIINNVNINFQIIYNFPLTINTIIVLIFDVKHWHFAFFKYYDYFLYIRFDSWAYILTTGYIVKTGNERELLSSIDFEINFKLEWHTYQSIKGCTIQYGLPKRWI